jgi:hypothetical protein
MRCVALHFFSKALLGSSSPRHYLAFLLQGVALPFFSFPMRCFAILLFPGASRSVSSALLCISSPAWGCAFLLPGVAQRFFSKALLCISSPKRCCAFLIRRVAGASIAAAMRLTAYPSRCFTLRFLSDAFHCFALPHFAPAKQNSANALYCFSTPQPCPATQCSSTPVLHGAYPLGPLPAPISVLGEELPDPALGIEREPICPGRGLAHDAPYILEVCLRSVGVPLDDHLVVDVKDHPVSGLLEVV